MTLSPKRIERRFRNGRGLRSSARPTSHTRGAPSLPPDQRFTRLMEEAEKLTPTRFA